MVIDMVEDQIGTTGKVPVEEKLDTILRYGREVAKGKHLFFSPNADANELVQKEPFAFLMAVLMDQMMPAEIVWTIPWELQGIWGHLDPKKIAEMTPDHIVRSFIRKPRFPNNMASWIISAARKVNREYYGRADNIWNDNPLTSDLQNRFNSFEGISQKKASMATNILARDFRIPVRHYSGVDISVDQHVIRVFNRLGLTEDPSGADIVERARELHPDFPGELDLPVWEVGRTHCHPSNPECGNCQFDAICDKRIDA